MKALTNERLDVAALIIVHDKIIQGVRHLDGGQFPHALHFPLRLAAHRRVAPWYLRVRTVCRIRCNYAFRTAETKKRKNSRSVFPLYIPQKKMKTDDRFAKVQSNYVNVFCKSLSEREDIRLIEFEKSHNFTGVMRFAYIGRTWIVCQLNEKKTRQ